MMPGLHFEMLERVDQGPRVREDETLSTLIHLAIEADAPIVVQNEAKDVGVVTRRDILQTVIEGTEVS